MINPYYTREKNWKFSLPVCVQWRWLCNTSSKNSSSVTFLWI